MGRPAKADKRLKPIDTPLHPRQRAFMKRPSSQRRGRNTSQTIAKIPAVLTTVKIQSA
jgi:hypothetical protein